MPKENVDIIEQLRNKLQPQGTSPVVGLRLENRFFNHNFIVSCIDELEKVTYRAVFLEEQVTPLEKLAYILLCDSASIKIKL